MAKETPKSGKGSQIQIPSSPDSPAGLYARYKDLLGYLFVAVVAIVALSALMMLNTRAKEKAAGTMFQSAVILHENQLSKPIQPDTDESETPVEPANQAADKLQEIIDNYPNTNAAVNSSYLLGMNLLYEGKYDNALSVLGDFINAHPDHILVPAALLGQSTAQYNLGRVDESKQVLEKIKSQYLDYPQMDIVQYEYAKRLEELEQWDNARKEYNDLMELYPDSPWHQMAQTRVTELDRKHPMENNDIPGDEAVS